MKFWGVASVLALISFILGYFLFAPIGSLGEGEAFSDLKVHPVDVSDPVQGKTQTEINLHAEVSSKKISIEAAPKEELVDSTPKNIKPYEAKSFDEMSDPQTQKRAEDKKTWEDLALEDGLRDPWVSDRELELREMELPLEARSFVEEVAAMDEITNEDIFSLRAVCQNDRDCIEKGAMIWMDSNHLFSEEQVAILDRD